MAGRRLVHHVPLKFVLKKVTGGGHRAVNQELPLVPFIDFLLCIVLFLLAVAATATRLATVPVFVRPAPFALLPDPPG